MGKDVLSLTIGGVSSRVKCDSEGLSPSVAARGSVARVDVKKDASETQLRQKGELHTYTNT